MIYGLESVAEIRDEITVLIDEVWEEVDQRRGLTSLQPDFDKYTMLTENGFYRPYTIRTDDRELVGYMGIFVQPSLHCTDRDAITDLMFIRSEHRGLGATLLELIEEDLREEGITNFSFVTKVKLDSGRLAEKLGYTLHEKTYQKRL